MSDTENEDTPTDNQRIDDQQSDNRQMEPKPEYTVGYRKPPAEHRFKHGNQANPRGRSKGSRNRKLVIRDVLFQLVTMREGDKTRQIPAIEAVLTRVLSKALAGDNKAAITIIGIAQREGFLTPEQEQVVDKLSDYDRSVLEDFKRRLGESHLDSLIGDGDA